MSLDGLVGQPDEVPACSMSFYDDKFGAEILDLISSAGVHAMGRGAYQEMAPYWQSSTDPLAKPMNEIPKAVFSRTTTEATWPESTIYEDLESGMAELKAQEGGPILTYGGATFAQELARLGLVDEYSINVHPIAFGEGSGGLPRRTRPLTTLCSGRSRQVDRPPRCLLDGLASRESSEHPRHISPHSLRHAAITNALDAGVPLRDAQIPARHADPRTTEDCPDRARGNLDRHDVHFLTACVAGVQPARARPRLARPTAPKVAIYREWPTAPARRGVAAARNGAMVS